MNSKSRALRGPWWLSVTVGSLPILSGCPVFDSPSGDDAAGASTPDSAAGAGGLSRETYEEMAAKAIQERYPEAPTIEALCKLAPKEEAQSVLTYDEIKQILGEPDEQSQDASEAAMNYRYKSLTAEQAAAYAGPQSGAAGGDAGVSTGWDRGELVSLYLKFEWWKYAPPGTTEWAQNGGEYGTGSIGSVCVGLFGCGPSEARLNQYVSVDKSITGAPWPYCWPHKAK